MPYVKKEQKFINIEKNYILSNHKYSWIKRLNIKYSEQLLLLLNTIKINRHYIWE